MFAPSNLFLRKPKGTLDHILLEELKIENKPIPQKIIDNFTPPDILDKNKIIIDEDGKEKPLKDFEKHEYILLVSKCKKGILKLERAGSLSECKRKWKSIKESNTLHKLQFFDCSQLNTAKLFVRWELFLQENFPSTYNF